MIKKIVFSDEPTEESEPQEEVQEEESSSKGTEDSEVQTADSEEQDGVQSERRSDVDSDKGIATDVANRLKLELEAMKNGG